jgi:hypothetical protein
VPRPRQRPRRTAPIVPLTVKCANGHSTALCTRSFSSHQSRAVSRTSRSEAETRGDEHCDQKLAREASAVSIASGGRTSGNRSTHSGGSADMDAGTASVRRRRPVELAAAPRGGGRGRDVEVTRRVSRSVLLPATGSACPHRIVDLRAPPSFVNSTPPAVRRAWTSTQARQFTTGQRGTRSARGRHKSEPRLAPRARHLGLAITATSPSRTASGGPSAAWSACVCGRG